MNQNLETQPVEGPAREAAAREYAGREAELADTTRGAIAEAVKDLPVEALTEYRAFVNPTHPNTKYLVKHGELVQLRDQNSATGMRDTQRIGDIWAEFTGGVCVTNVKAVIEWAEARPTICRDANVEGTEFWYNVKRAQMSLANQDPSLDAGIDVDAALSGGGNFAPAGVGGTVSSARQFAETANERA